MVRGGFAAGQPLNHPRPLSQLPQMPSGPPFPCGWATTVGPAVPARAFEYLAWLYIPYGWGRCQPLWTDTDL